MLRKTAGRPHCGDAVHSSKLDCLAESVTAVMLHSLFILFSTDEEWQWKEEQRWFVYKLIFTSVGQKQKTPFTSDVIKLLSTYKHFPASAAAPLCTLGRRGGNNSKLAAQCDGCCMSPAFPFFTVPINLNLTVTLTPIGDSQIQK